MQNRIAVAMSGGVDSSTAAWLRAGRFCYASAAGADADADADADRL